MDRTCRRPCEGGREAGSLDFSTLAGTCPMNYLNNNFGDSPVEHSLFRCVAGACMDNAEYGAIEQRRYPTFATAIIAQYESTFASTAANALAAVLVLCCLLLITFEVILRGRSRVARVGSGAARTASPVAPGKRTLSVFGSRSVR